YTYKGRTVVPVRFISEFLNGQVEWKGDTKSVIINFNST
ncbi:MAG: stalk domain-containing protein, partial [Candidatus Pelagibacter ubique]